MPPSGFVLAGLLAFYICAGLFFHDPWKNEDAIHIGVVYDLLVEGAWTNLQLAGRPWGEAPFYYWMAAICANFFSNILPLHSGIRASNILWMAIALVAIYYASRELFGRTYAAAAPLILVGSLGLIVDAHMANPALSLMAGASLLMLAIALLPRKPYLAFSLVILAVFLISLASSTIHLLPLVIFATCTHIAIYWQKSLPTTLVLVAGELAPNPNQKALLPRANLGARNYKNLRLILPALFLGFLFVAIFVYCMRTIDSQALNNYLVYEHITWNKLQFFNHLWLDNLVRLPWFAWPAFPLIFWTLWSYRQEILNSDLINPLLFILIYLIYYLGISGQNQRDEIVILLPALALIATPAALSLRPGARNALDWFNRLFISSVIIIVWLGWMAMNFQFPSFAAKYFQRHSLGFVAEYSFWSISISILLSIFWLWLMISLKRSAYRAITIWCGGLTCLWMLIVTLWLPWIDYGKSYREVSYQIASQVDQTFKIANDKKIANRKPSKKSSNAKQTNIINQNEEPSIFDRNKWEETQLNSPRKNCVSEINVGEAQLASFAYFTGLQLETSVETNCRWLIIQGRNSAELKAPNTKWQQIWEGARKNDSQERFRLYQWKTDM